MEYYIIRSREKNEYSYYNKLFEPIPNPQLSNIETLRKDRDNNSMKWGVKNRKQKIIIKYEYDDIKIFFTPKDSLLRMLLNKRNLEPPILVDEQGQSVFPKDVKINNIRKHDFDKYNYDKTMYHVINNGRSGVMDYKGQWVLPAALLHKEHKDSM